MEGPKKPVLIYDEDCQLCKRFKQALDLIDRDGAIVKRPLQDDSLYEEYPELKREECEKTIHLISSEGKVLKGSSAIEYLIGVFPGVKKFAWLVESESGKKAVDFFYGKVNELRRKVKEDCENCGNKR